MPAHSLMSLTLPWHEAAQLWIVLCCCLCMAQHPYMRAASYWDSKQGADGVFAPRAAMEKSMAVSSFSPNRHLAAA